MSNPSTVWAQLSLPFSPVGSIPYVDIDGATIVTDVANFQYLSVDYQSFSGTQLPYQLTVSNGFRVSYTDATSLPTTSYTINKPSGRITIPQGESSATVTSSCCFESSMVLLQLISADATFTIVTVASAAGSFVITGNSNATLNVDVDFLIINRR